MNSQVDKILVDEVYNFAMNDYDTYNKLVTIYLDNLKKKRVKGTYDKKKSYKLLEYYYQNYVRPNMKNPRKYGLDPKLNPKERQLVSKYFGDYLWVEFIKNVRPKPKTIKK
jgi:hypothetical protein